MADVLTPNPPTFMPHPPDYVPSPPNVVFAGVPSNGQNFTKKDKDACLPLVDVLVNCANIARVSGVLALDEYALKQRNDFLRFAVGLVTDGTDPELLEDVLKTLTAADNHTGKALLERVLITKGVLAVQAGFNPKFVEIGLLGILGENYLRERGLFPHHTSPLSVVMNMPEGFDTKKDGQEYGELTEVEYFSNTTGANRKCFVYTPPNYSPDETYPVMYLLHGIGGTHTEWLGGNPNEVISNLITSGEARPMIAVIPNVRAMKNDSLPENIFGEESIKAFDNFINDLRDDLMPFIKKNYKVSEKRSDTAVAGLSMGGRESLYIGLSMPGIFKYIGAFSPAPGVLEFKSERHPVSHKGLFKPEEMTLPQEFIKDTFILINNGREEEMFDGIARNISKTLLYNGVFNIHYVTEGGHDFRVWKHGLYNFVRNFK